MKLVVAGAFALATAATPPFPPPKRIAVTAELKCDWGTIESAGSETVIKSFSGLVHYQVSSSVPVVGIDGRSPLSRSALKPGQAIRVYYLVDDGALAKEIDVIPAAPAGSPAPG
jgi:hypothetical protein